MKLMKRNLFLLPIFAVLAGCVPHLSQQQCLSINWHNEGYNDGVAGKMPRDLSQAVQDCAQYHISIDQSIYQAGWQAGARKYCTPSYSIGFTDGSAGKSLNDINSRSTVCAAASTRLRLNEYKPGWQKGIQSFCTYENGNLLGQQGKPLPDVCPASLQADFSAGWNKGKGDFCSQTANAFALGKENKPYPNACTPELYVAFKAEYDRGAAIGQRIKDLKQQIKDIDDEISDKANKYSLNKKDDGYYELGYDSSQDAVNAKNQVNAWVDQKRPLENDLFNLKVMR